MPRWGRASLQPGCVIASPFASGATEPGVPTEVEPVVSSETIGIDGSTDPAVPSEIILAESSDKGCVEAAIELAAAVEAAAFVETAGADQSKEPFQAAESAHDSAGIDRVAINAPAKNRTMNAAGHQPLRRWRLKFLEAGEEEDEANEDTRAWKVMRCASKSKSSRDQEGGNRSAQGKIDCSALDVKKEGVIGMKKGLFNTTREEDFNNYRTTGHKGRFVPCTPDRAVSLVTVSAYEALRGALPGINIQDGDLGENLLLSGPSIDAGIDLDVGTVLQIGNYVQLELTEANKPCYRLQYLSWAGHAKKAVGVEKWWESHDLPLGRHRPGGRGWLCKVLVEGVIKPGDDVHKL